MNTSSSAARVLFLAGAGHSGSTLVSFVLNTHRDIFAIGEMHAPRFPIDEPMKRMCSCGRPVATCPFFDALTESFRSQGSRLDPLSWDLRYAVSHRPLMDRLYVGSLRNTTLESLRDRLWALTPRYRRTFERLHRDNLIFFRSALEISGKRVFLDATKRPIRMRYLNRIPGLDLRVVHLVRDPRAYTYSRMRDKGMTAAEAADAWYRTNRNADRHLGGLPAESWMRLRYEDFCSATAAALERVGRFAGIGPIEVPDNFRAGTHHIMGNKMRLSTRASTTIRLDSQWREKLSPIDLRAVAGRAESLARSYGYDDWS